MATRLRNKALGAFALGALIAACGSSDPESTFDGGDGTGNGTDTDGGLIGSGGGGDPDSGFGTTNDGGLPPGCAADTQKAKQLPLDLYMMLDTSGSMTGVTGSTTKWEAVKQAITAFVNDGQSVGIGVGVQYFPIIVPNTTAQTCANDAACGALTPCIHNKACAKAGPLTYCSTNADCGANVVCSDLGICSVSNGGCLRDGGFGCGTGGGTCQYFAASYCAGRDSCKQTDYGAPAVPILALPGNAAAIITSLGAHAPDGLTPSAPALQGAVNGAKTHAAANAGHTVVAVLVTDGFPTECSPQDIPSISQIAQTGASGQPAVKTFVIGVFTPSEKTTATANLNQIAASGGTNTAFVIDTTQNVSTEFLKALNQIRGASLPCEYTLPIPEAGTPDYGKVNVQYTSGTGVKELLLYATNAAGCDAAKGGWYYDKDPATGGTPTKVIMCPATCNKLKADANGQIDVVQGCSTVVR